MNHSVINNMIQTFNKPYTTPNFTIGKCEIIITPKTLTVKQNNTTLRRFNTTHYHGAPKQLVDYINNQL